jgi:hypothetical protein
VKREVERVEKAKELLDAVLAATVEVDRLLQTMDTLGLVIEGVKGRKKENAGLLWFVDAERRGLQKKRSNIRIIRRRVEIQIWEGQKVSPTLNRLIDILKLSGCAKGCIPAGVKTIRDLCTLRSTELPSSDPMYINEIKDALRSFGLVLKPDNE